MTTSSMMVPQYFPWVVKSFREIFTIFFIDPHLYFPCSHPSFCLLVFCYHFFFFIFCSLFDFQIFLVLQFTQTNTTPYISYPLISLHLTMHGLPTTLISPFLSSFPPTADLMLYLISLHLTIPRLGLVHLCWARTCCLC